MSRTAATTAAAAPSPTINATGRRRLRTQPKRAATSSASSSSRPSNGVSAVVFSGGNDAGMPGIDDLRQPLRAGRCP